METINHIPVYKARVTDEEQGIYNISFVDDPAVELNWLAFSEDKKPLMFSIQNEEQRLVRGVVMTANKPIYRISPAGEEYYLVFDAETIRIMAEKYLKDGFQNQVDTQHNFQMEEGVEMVQWFIKDTAAGINPTGFDCEDGSLFAEFHILNDQIWEEVKAGTYKGFSLAGCFNIYEEEFKKVNELDEILALVEKINNKLKNRK